jgi:2-polyprenyl-3-methyl-5-hydroxy-6-metoxy-1,4-benzoquinol methylase
MEVTGERMIPEFHKDDFIYSEHWGRYIFASQFVKNKVVLDAASGSGYGSKYMAQAGAKSVVGIDNSQEAVEYSKKYFNHPKVRFLARDIHKIPFKDKHFDVVVAFEMVEHLGDYEKFLSEVKRVLKPSGVLILSTPNEEVYPEGNEFHLHEFHKEELDALLDKFFKTTKVFYQKSWASGAILDEEAMRFEDFFNKLNVATHKLSSFNLERSEYFVTVSSDNKSVFEKGIELENTLFKDFPTERFRFLERSVLDIGARNQELESTINDIHQSKSWKIVMFLRRMFFFRKKVPILKRI